MSANSRYDVVIIGGGHNGLICGAYLEVVLEQEMTKALAAAPGECARGPFAIW